MAEGVGREGGREGRWKVTYNKYMNGGNELSPSYQGCYNTMETITIQWDATIAKKHFEKRPHTSYEGPREWNEMN